MSTITAKKWPGVGVPSKYLFFRTNFLYFFTIFPLYTPFFFYINMVIMVL
ncbi:hypothetical protein TREPR_2923 [Treponema primitia ZAS-2]|uniref:Uncharacterized protein n=1 Tax=Treponema primitia (strain ATCC BAA-887 / DSM 12427 / ZAS-2) TaxID=545694 RepID=F5YP77_TREPZ|nr:hypothetical protein TREPR_2923 [Treponema primitia ZAS-2]